MWCVIWQTARKRLISYFALYSTFAPSFAVCSLSLVFQRAQLCWLFCRSFFGLCSIPWKSCWIHFPFGLNRKMWQIIRRESVSQQSEMNYYFTLLTLSLLSLADRREKRKGFLTLESAAGKELHNHFSCSNEQYVVTYKPMNQNNLDHSYYVYKSCWEDWESWLCMDNVPDVAKPFFGWPLRLEKLLKLNLFKLRWLRKTWNILCEM